MSNQPNAAGYTIPDDEPTACEAHDQPMLPGSHRFSCMLNHRNAWTSAHAECGLCPSLQTLRGVKRSFPRMFSEAPQRVFQMAFRHMSHWESIPSRGKEWAVGRKVRSAIGRLPRSLRRPQYKDAGQTMTYIEHAAFAGQYPGDPHAPTRPPL